MILFIKKLLRLSRPYRQRLVLGVLMGLLAGLLEPSLMLCVKVAVDVAFPGSGTLSSNSPTITPDRVRNFPALAARLKAQSDGVSQYLWNRLSPVTRQEITESAGVNALPEGLQDRLVGELNLAILDPALYDPQRFANVKLSPPAAQLLAKHSPADQTRLNRLLLESAFPTELKSSKLSFMDSHPWVRERMAQMAGWLPGSGIRSRTLDVTLVILSIPVMMLLRGVVGYLNVYFLQWVAIRTITDLRTRLFAHLMHMPLAFLNKVSTGELLSRVTSDTMALQQAISSSLVVLIKDPATLLGLIILVLWQQPMLALVSLVVFPVCLVPIIIYSRKVRASSRAIQKEYAQLSRVMHESFTGNRIIKAYNLEQTAIGQFNEGSKRFIGHYMRAVRAGEMPGPLIEFFGAIGVACIFYYILLVSNRDIDAGDFLLFVGSIFSMYRPFKSMSRLYNQLEQANAASERVFELLATPSSLAEPANPVPLKAAGAEIKFENINFLYDSKPVLSDFNLVVKPGQMVALVGQTGSGKTTVTNLLLRFYDPQGGAVLIGGVDIRQVLTRDLRAQIAMVSQDTLLFDETIRRNIELGRPGATEMEIVAAARHAHAEEFIKEKPQGYDTLIGEKGIMLSGGQKQRLAIARAILKDAPILVLDEATSALDTKTERAVQAALDELMEGRTTLCIAHRLSTIQRADVIVVLDHGRIVEMGKHEELLARRGVYHRLYELDLKPHQQST